MDAERIKEILETSRTIAVVGLSPKEDRPSHRVASYLQAHGYRIIPVNPSVPEILGERSYRTLEEIPKEINIDVVDVFRRPEDVVPIAEQAVAIGARTLWLQEGVISEEGAATAHRGGLFVVMDRCMLKDHQKLL
jgi:predicted CoA-binding protein